MNGDRARQNTIKGSANEKMALFKIDLYTAPFQQ
jgi:hypothetical protein